MYLASCALLEKDRMIQVKGSTTMETGHPSLKIGYLPTIYHTSFILMGTTALDNDGVETEWTLFPSGPDIVNAISSGHIDLGYVGLPPVIIGIDKGVRLACIAGGHIEGTVMIAGKGVRTLDQCAGMAEFLAQFAGGVIGCPPRGSIHDVIVNELLKEHHIEDVRVRNYAWADFLPDALIEGDIAVAAGTPALAVAARRYYDARIVVQPPKLWPYNPSYGIVVTKELLNHEDPLRTFLLNHEEACEMVRHSPRTCARIVAQTTGVVDEGFVEEAYQISPKYCASLPPEYIRSTMQFVEALYSLGYISRQVDETEIFDASLIKDVHPAPPHYESRIQRTL